MSTMSVRLPESLHQKARELAKQEGVSINQLVTTALAEKLSALLTEEYIEERGRRGSREKFEKALSKVPERQPLPEDEL
ncbi:MAG: toxin-antitoxin system HicB family antitoxin [Gemmatimonadales bacterium]|nr:MAG: toxin-antitoxin system HicB family antitoxin [Gemmatimonadales bacterium]